MKKTIKSKGIIIIIILILLNLPSLSSDSINNYDTKSFFSQNNESKTSFNNHTIIVEVASSQGCSGCNTFNTIIYNQYLNGSIDFEFVEMIVYDHSWDILNNKSYGWKEIYNIFSYPTSIFDGGFEQLGGSNPEILIEKLEICQNRQVYNIDAEIIVTLIGDSKFNISINIRNNENNTYDGTIRSHITEVVSRYTTNTGNNYHNGFLDFAFNKNISILPNETYFDNIIWDGNNHQDAHGDSFDNISKNNTKIYLSVFDDKGFCDEVVVAMSSDILELIDTNQSISDRGFPIRHALDGDWAAAQSFMPTINTLTSTEIYMRKFGTPEFNLTVELRSNDPQGTLIDTLVFTPDQTPSSWEWFPLDFTDTPITPGTDYFIVIPPAPSGVTTSFGYEWGYAFGNQYDDGAFWFTRDGGGLWRDLPTMYEFVFRTYGYD